MNRGRRVRLMVAAIRAARADEPALTLCGAVEVLQVRRLGTVALDCEQKAPHVYDHAHFLPDGSRVTWSDRART